MINNSDLDQLISGKGSVHTDTGDKLGSIGEFYLDDTTGGPSWVTVHTGLFGTKVSFVPLHGALAEGNDVRVPYRKDLVKDAPSVERDGHLSPEEEDTLYRHYSFSNPSAGTTDNHNRGTVSSNTSDAGNVQTARSTSGEHASDGTMIRSKEELRVGLETRETGRARLRKHIVTETVTTTVPLAHEEVRLVREPITHVAAGEAVTIGEDVVEVTLTADRPVVEKEVVAVERVRLDKEVVTEQQTINEQVREEKIELITDDTNKDDVNHRR